MTETKHLKSKICLVGEKAVGKTSLIRRYVLNMFDDHYITTIGTKVSKKEVRAFQPERDRIVDVDMTIWDIMGEKGFRELLKDAYFYGANGILAVADLTRRRTLDDLDDWIDGVEQVVGRVPTLIAVNKADLPNDGQFSERDVAQVAKAFECEYLMTSAKTGDNVEEAFRRLGALVAGDQLNRA
ncbi:MAG TPA: Rab family GTPase [Thermoplasmata archaeon]|nr:Rab family GTPase [Thermoplasmata archaeon]